MSALSRKKPRGFSRKGVSLYVVFRDKVVAVDKLTRESTYTPAKAGPLSDGLHLKSFSVPSVPPGYSLRSELPVSMPVFRIDLR